MKSRLFEYYSSVPGKRRGLNSQGEGASEVIFRGKTQRAAKQGLQWAFGPGR